MNVATAIALTDTKRKALAALLEGATVQGAAAHAGVARETVSHWKNHDAAFRAELARAQQELHEGTIAALKGLVPQALGVLRSCMAAKKPSTRLRAASTVLRFGIGRDGMVPPQRPKEDREDGDSPTEALLLGDGDDAPPQQQPRHHQAEETPACFRLDPEMEAMRAETERIQAEIVALRAVRAGMGPDEG